MLLLKFNFQLFIITLIVRYDLDCVESTVKPPTTNQLGRVGLISAAVASHGLKDGDLVILTLRRLTAGAQLPSDAVNSLPPERRVFGFIKQVQRHSMRNVEQLHPLISES